MGIENFGRLSQFLQAQEEQLNLHRARNSQKYEFDFEDEKPIPTPHPSYNYTPINNSKVPSYYHAAIAKLDDKPQAEIILEQILEKKKQLKSDLEILEARFSFSTQASTFVSGDRMSTIQNFIDSVSERNKTSIINMTDRGEDQDHSYLMTRTITENYDSSNQQITETVTTTSMIEEQIEHKIPSISKESIVRHFKQKIAQSQKTTPLKNPVLPSLSKEPLQLKAFTNLNVKAIPNVLIDGYHKKVDQEEKKQKQNSPKVSSFFAESNSPMQKLNLNEESKSPSSSQKTPYQTRKIKSNERIKFDLGMSATAQNSPARKQLFTYNSKNVNNFINNSASKSPQYAQDGSLSHSNKKNLPSVKETSSIHQTSAHTTKNKSDEKRTQITNKIGYKKMLAGDTTRNFQQLKSVMSHHSFTLKKFNQSSGSVQQVKSFQTQNMKLSPSIEQKTAPKRKQNEESSFSNNDYFQFGNSTNGCLIGKDQQNEDDSIIDSPTNGLISNIKQIQINYRKQSDQEPESQKLLPNTTHIAVTNTNARRAKDSLKSRNFMKENLTSKPMDKKSQSNSLVQLYNMQKSVENL
ncbi:UNKNOWN [Stylonychia lemnae]|uniref:Uncharacterized protein n=1 Tax=Stylonychia lemnae TaxID=5949 RepID=A0A077ZSP7_STYLE|nr:UNKNOWN [Stylonychia lemnae]|eukprot:CDW71501.1 UNKNOWN [Stylonychia lemnae]